EQAASTSIPNSPYTTLFQFDAYFLEYDDDRSGDFRPLRFLPKNKLAVLGLVTTKFGQLESKDDLKRRIEQAAQYAPLEQLALSRSEEHTSELQSRENIVYLL